MHSKSRAAALGFSFVGALVNIVLALHVLSFWRILRWESESEWESSAYGWRINTFKLVWLLVFAYFSTAGVVSVIGAIGIVRRMPAFIRLYRDYSLADICACGLLTIFTAVASFRSTARATLCEELSGQAELLRDLAEAGLNPENCEQWFEHAVVGFVAVTLILLVVRLQFILTVTNYHKELMRQIMHGPDVAMSSAERWGSDTREGQQQRIFLLPSRGSLHKSRSNHSHNHHNSGSISSGTGSGCSSGSGSGSGSGSDSEGGTPRMLVYAPVPLDSLSESEARSLAANEAWISRAPPHSAHAHASGNGHVQAGYASRHSYSHSHGHGHGRTHSRSHRHNSLGSFGRIVGLPVLSEELPSYRDEPERDRKA